MNSIKKRNPKLDRVRYEQFGGIVSCTNPPFLAWVNREYMKKIGYTGSELWNLEGPQEYLSAPTEVHFSVTNKCDQLCSGCYMSSKSEENEDVSLAELKKGLRELAEMGVFHVALGGGEAFERADFGEIVTYCREIGLVPNLTTHGQNINKEQIEVCKKLGQVNISIDGIGGRYSINGRGGSFENADKTFQRLHKAKIKTGINCVVSKKNFHDLENIVAYAKKRHCNEVEFLKFKPSGRAKNLYHDFALTQEMIREFYPKVLELTEKYQLELKMDCSFIPALVYHTPPIDDLEKLGVTGCDGGNLLLSVRSNGHFSGCSFVSNDEHVSNITEKWQSSPHLNAFRNLIKTAKEPCKSCDYLAICKTGCRANTLYYEGDFFGPDPECPIVYDYAMKKGY